MKTRRMGSVYYRAPLSFTYVEVMFFPHPEPVFLKNLAIHYVGEKI